MESIEKLEKFLLKRGKVRISEVLEHFKEIDDLKGIIDHLNEKYKTACIPLRFVLGKKFVTVLVEDEEREVKKLPASCYEVLAVLALFGDLSRYEIERIRGVASAKPIARLLELGLIEVKGKTEGIKRSYYVYGLSDRFLEEFGFLGWEDLKLVVDAVKSELEEETTQTDGS